MSKIKNILYRMFPERGFKSVMIVWAVHFAAYLVPKLVNMGRTHMSLSTGIDDAIPFIPWFIVFYVLAFFQWVRMYMLLAREDEGVMKKYLTAAMISKLVCMVFFVIMPTTITRPEVSGRGLFTWCCKVVFMFDTPTNLFPSMHCLESWLCLRLALEERKLERMPEIARSIANGYSGEMIRCANKKEWNEIKENLTESSEQHRSRIRKEWRFDKKLEAAADDAANVAEAAGAVYVRSHTAFTCILSVLVVLSTVFVKQHYFVDTVTGILLAEISLFAAGMINKSSVK